MRHWFRRFIFILTLLALAALSIIWWLTRAIEALE